MPFVPVANCTMCKIRWSANTNQCENTFAFYWGAGVPTGPELTALAAAMAPVLGFALRKAMSDQDVFRQIICTNINAVNGNQGVYNFPPNTKGDRLGSTVALNEASGIIKRTAQIGRANRGRNSISGFIEGDVNGNSISSGLMALLGDIAIALLQSYLAGRFIPAVASRSRGTAVPLTSASVIDDNVDSQKTRLNAHGT